VLTVIIAIILHNTHQDRELKNGWCEISAQLALRKTECVCASQGVTLFPLNGGTLAQLHHYRPVNASRVSIQVGERKLSLFRAIVNAPTFYYFYIK
jgi:hypothetical protein